MTRVSACLPVCLLPVCLLACLLSAYHLARTGHLGDECDDAKCEHCRNNNMQRTRPIITVHTYNERRRTKLKETAPDGS